MNFYETTEWPNMFHTLLSPEAFAELQAVRSLKPDALNHTGAVDSWEYDWGQVYPLKNSMSTAIKI